MFAVPIKSYLIESGMLITSISNFKITWCSKHHERPLSVLTIPFDHLILFVLRIQDTRVINHVFYDDTQNGTCGLFASNAQIFLKLGQRRYRFFFSSKLELPFAAVNYD